MNYLKTILITTILLNIHSVFCGQYEAYTQEPPINLEEVLKAAESTTTTTPQEEAQTKTETSIESTPVTASTVTQEEAIEKSELQKTQPAIASATAGWNDHLAALAEKGKLWDATNNIPTSSWKADAFTLAKEALNKDKNLAETIKSQFRTALKTKIVQENGDPLSDDFINLLKDFDNTIDAHVKTITEAEAAKEAEKAKVLEETKPEPVAEPTPAPAEIAPTPPVEETKISQPETVTPATETTRDIIKEWNSLLEDIIKEGINLEENITLLQKAYTIARELFVKKPEFADTIKSNLENAIIKHNEDLLLEPIDIKQAMAAFSEVTGIKQPSQQRATTEQKLKQEALEKQKEAAITLATIEKIREEAPAPKASEIQELGMRLKRGSALAHAADQAALNAKLEEMRKELATLRKVKVEKAPEAERGILGTIKQWWYGEPQISIAALNQERTKKLQELLDAMTTLTLRERQSIEESWNIFTSSLQSFESLDKDNKEAVKEWLATIEQALRNLTITHNILFIQDISHIIEDTIKESPDRTKIIKEIRKYLEEEKQKIIYEKQQKEAAILKRTQQREEKKELAMLEQQRARAEKERMEAKKEKRISKVKSYKNEKNAWKDFLNQIAHNTQATEEDNKVYTIEAIKKAESLINRAHKISPKKKHSRAEKLKKEFIKALVQQPKVNKHEINIQPNIDHFNKAIDNMIE